ncbi:hypothetical protein NSK_002800 [Nannochloropsis salina CCMP1776]|uniref:Kinesin motor domain-containing protein n=1 Tax=Nannochloropsis salina CCMP1776 TaxID=1027361 RepID=A0A4D9D3G3_9STRA|nr:hypothetical protein NSK_002800 [Nannochloropsis salina CCMP1776]|eukprot:TFJ85980.1 hypothetical protein NSK_002800 [Nannochloropsis salina CCMP1776]
MSSAAPSAAGNEEGICVAIRARPMSSREKIQGQRALWRCLPAHDSITLTGPDGNPLPDRSPGLSFFTYDKVFSENSSTSDVYHAIGRPIVSSVLQGFNGTIFAYGQTSSGKTYTMVGDETGGEEGVLHLAARDIFRLISETNDRDFLLRVSFVEIYNENIRDLLDPETPSLSIREDPRKGVYLEAHESIITDFDSIMTALKTGSRHRRVESTAMNERSSRSHTIFRMIVESKARPAQSPALAPAAEAEGANPGPSPGDGDMDGAVLVATLNLVDLAGSESVRHTGATGNRAKEGGKINQSLLTLSRVIHALGQDGSVHKGFRDSKLTRILQPSLSGNAKMAVVCCITAAERYLEETRSTLQFASRAKMVRTRAVVNEVLDDRAQLKRLKKELQDLKGRQRQLEECEAAGGLGARGGEGGGVDEEQVHRLEAEKQLMTGKVEELEAVREEQANKIARLKTLILQGGGVLEAAAETEVAETGCKIRRPKRTRETWCPGESGVPLPPGALVKSSRGLAREGRESAECGASRVSGASSQRRRTELLQDSEVEEAGAQVVAGASGHEKGVSSMATEAEWREQAAALEEMAQVREVLSVYKRHCQAEAGKEEESEAPSSVLETIKSLVAMGNQAASGPYPCLYGDMLHKEEEDDQEDATVQLPSLSEMEKLAAVVEDKDQEVARLVEERDQLKTVIAEKTMELDAAVTALADVRAAGAQGLGASLTDDDGDATVSLDPEVQGLMTSMAERDAELRELQTALQAAGERDQTYEVEVASLQQQLADATTALTGMMGPDQADALRREHEDAVGNLQARVAELEESHAMAEAEVERLVEKQTTTVDKAEVAALEAAHESAWASLQVQLAEAEESKAAALAEIEAVRAAQAGMMGEEDLHALRTNHEDALAELQRRVVDVTEQHAAASKEIQNLVAAQSAMISKGEVQLIQEKHERALAEMQRQIAELEEAKGAAMAEVDSLSTARKTMLDKDEVNCLRLIHEQAIEALRSENKVLEEGKMHAVAEMEKVLAAQRVAEAQVEELREELSGMEAQREELQRRVEAADAEHAALEDEKARHESSLCALRSEIEALREEGSQQMTALQEMVAVLKAQDAEGSALSCDKNLTGESSEDAGPEQGAATVTASLQELVQRLTAANVQLQARATTAEIEARGHAEENAHLKGRVGKFLRRRVSSLPLLEGAEDGHVQVMRAVRRRQGGGTEASNVESNSPSKELNAFAPAEVGEEGVEEAKEAYGLVERMTDMTHEMEQLEEELEGMTEALKGKEAELSEVKAALESKEEDCKRLTIELETATETAHGAEVKAAQKVEEQTERLAAELATARSEIEAFKTIQLAFPNDDVTIAMQQPGEDPPAIAAHEEALEEASKRLEALTTEVAVVKAQLEEKNHEVEKLRCDAFHYQRQFQPIQEKEVDADEKDATVENQNKLQGQLLNEKNARAEAEGQLASAMADFNQTRDDLRRAVERLRASDELLEKTQEAARKERERIENELAVREAEVAALKGEVQELSREVKHAQESLSQRQMAAQGAEQTDESLRKRLSQIQTQLDLAQSLVDRHEARIKELEAENCRVIRVAEDDVQKIRGELERATKGQSQATAREAEVQMLQEAQQALTKKVTLLQAERDDAEQRATAAADALESLEKDMEASRLASAGQEGHVGEMERLRKELQKACEQETESRQEVQEQRVRQKRFQNEVAALQDECSRARDELESVRAELAAATAAQSDQHTAAAAATAEVDMLRKKLAQAQNVEDARTLEVQEACALAKARTNEFALELEGAQARLVAVEAELETTKATAEKADRSRAELLKELNAIFEAKFEAESRVAALEDEIHQLKNKVAEAAGAEAKESEIEELRAALAQKEDDGYRTKRELAELKEAAEAAEEAMGTQQTEVARLQAESRAKDERIRKLDAVKLTTDQVEKLRKIKAEHAQFSTTNKMLRKELEALRQQQEAKTVAPGRSSGQALEAQSHTISDLMATRDSLQEKLHASMAACRKLDLERLSVQETLRELPLFENDGEAGLGFEDDVPDDLGVAVGVVVEKARLRLLAKHASGAHQAEERAMMLKEIETLKVEKDALKARLEDTEAGVDGAHEAEGVFRGKFAAASEKIKALEESNEAAAMKMKEAEMDRQMAAEETARNIRFLEKENLELMMELKKLREQTSKLQAELDRGASSSGLVCGTNALRPIYSQKSNVDAGSSTSQVSAADVNPLKTETTSSSNISCPLPSSKTLPAMTSLSAADKENMMAVGQKLLPVKHDETAPPFQSLADDETHDTNQCKQS